MPTFSRTAHPPTGARAIGRTNCTVLAPRPAWQTHYYRFFFFKGCGPHRDLPSSPTRRSSDLARTAAVRLGVAGQGQVYAGHVVPGVDGTGGGDRRVDAPRHRGEHSHDGPWSALRLARPIPPDRKSTRLNSSHLVISYAAFCLK